MRKEVPFPDYLLPLLPFVESEENNFVVFRSHKPFPKSATNWITAKRVERDFEMIEFNSPIEKIWFSNLESLIYHAYFEIVLHFKD